MSYRMDRDRLAIILASLRTTIDVYQKIAASARAKMLFADARKADEFIKATEMICRELEAESKKSRDGSVN